MDIFEQNTLIGTGKLFWNHAYYDTAKFEQVLKWVWLFVYLSVFLFSVEMFFFLSKQVFNYFRSSQLLFGFFSDNESQGRDIFFYFCHIILSRSYQFTSTVLCYVSAHGYMVIYTVWIQCRGGGGCNLESHTQEAPLGMKLVNNVTGEHQALPKEMLTKQKGLFVKFMLWRESRYPDFHTLSYTSICEIPNIL